MEHYLECDMPIIKMPIPTQCTDAVREMVIHEQRGRGIPKLPGSASLSTSNCKQLVT